MKGKEKMKKLKLRRWVKVVLFIIGIMLLFYIIISLFTKKTVIITESENYTCRGSYLFQVCSGVSYEE